MHRLEEPELGALELVEPELELVEAVVEVAAEPEEPALMCARDLAKCGDWFCYLSISRYCEASADSSVGSTG